MRLNLIPALLVTLAISSANPANLSAKEEILREPTVLGLEIPVFRAGEPLTAAQLNILASRLKETEAQVKRLTLKVEELEKRLKETRDQTANCLRMVKSRHAR